MLNSLRFIPLILLPLLFSHCTSDTLNPRTEPSKVYIHQLVASPTDEESVVLKNNTGSDSDLSGWTLGDRNDPDAYSIPAGTMLIEGGKRSWEGSTLGFQINDSDEIIYLKNASGQIVDTWSN
ncbi:lamin tail domain-containing protein [Phaeocystidibacter luteus]|uniref:Lamin tail domain-containing protein n=1 Tax=Phaeocystidibacter luteus TaxID=911197 RepID=A0A6N6RKE5_9FLAO|nr:lamin tail domain-containing protein [Phaeocystidibacter luteus]KAB2809996.1 lamin tail domain-containing protein [Phaeocystidibacter luteus]